MAYGELTLSTSLLASTTPARQSRSVMMGTYLFRARTLSMADSDMVVWCE
jgi:hypothetical protein